MIKVLSRWKILAGIRSIALLGLSGCTWLSGSRTDLAGVEVVNPYYGTERVDIQVEQADERVVEETLSIEQEEGSETSHERDSWSRPRPLSPVFTYSSSISTGLRAVAEAHPALAGSAGRAGRPLVPYSVLLPLLCIIVL